VSAVCATFPPCCWINAKRRRPPPLGWVVRQACPEQSRRTHHGLQNAGVFKTPMVLQRQSKRLRPAWPETHYLQPILYHPPLILSRNPVAFTYDFYLVFEVSSQYLGAGRALCLCTLATDCQIRRQAAGSGDPAGARCDFCPYFLRRYCSKTVRQVSP